MQHCKTCMAAGAALRNAYGIFVRMVKPTVTLLSDGNYRPNHARSTFPFAPRFADDRCDFADRPIG